MTSKNWWKNAACILLTFPIWIIFGIFYLLSSAMNYVASDSEEEFEEIQQRDWGGESQ